MGHRAPRATAGVLRRHHRHISIEDAKPVAPVRVGDVAPEGSQRQAGRTHVGRGAGSGGVELQVEPEAVAIGTSDSILDKLIVGICDPKTSWSLISIETGHGSLDSHD